MAVMEVSLPSGFVVDQDSLPSLRISQNVKRVETKDADTTVVLYFDKVSSPYQISLLKVDRKLTCSYIPFSSSNRSTVRPFPLTVLTWWPIRSRFLSLSTTITIPAGELVPSTSLSSRPFATFATKKSVRKSAVRVNR